ncbi:MAG: hypothetical protein HW380_1641 [Magnetococcales bacterium]|nr:hypothetical protein [Magnetococcales bacterium]HIJ84545.1 DUF3368 domain-containing protein [Magnetococcales bacterium]
MPEPVIINASPLIFLARSRQIHLLQHLHRPVLVPQPVVQEIRARGPHDPTVRTLNETAWLEIAPAPAIPSEILAWDLGLGESAVLALARSIPGSIALIDDQSGRRCAQTLRITLMGTVGLVLLAKQNGAIPNARAVLAVLREQGMYLSDSVLNAALSLVGESWR